MDHMHDHLTQLVDDSLGVRFKFPDGVKPHRAEGKHIRAYAGGHKFSQLEDWAMDICYHLAACCYGGDDMDQERIFVLHEFIDGEAQNWFHQHVLHTNRDKHDWTFKEVLIGLYNCFVNAATMQEACEAFRTATFYDDLVGHAQNMAVYLDEFTIQETFLDGIPAEMRRKLIHDNNLSPEVNTVTEFLAYAICYEQSAQTASHYDQRSLHQAQGPRQPVKVGTFLAKCSEMERNSNPQFVVRQMLPVGHKPVPGPPVNVPVARDTCYGPGAGQPGPKATRDAPPKVAPPKAAFGGSNAGYRPNSGAARCYNCGRIGHYSKDCKAPRVQVQAAHMAAVGSNAESNTDAEPEELVKDKEAPQEGEEQSAGDDAESIQIDGDEYVAVDVYNNDYYTRDDEEEHMFALTEHQDD
ncbi:hypothetical protein C0992_007007 [Termitomyces sp. T32_za158]|nr:hypothetical protein C0992_007007 [Termitomyces sp. T32_za158]